MNLEERKKYYQEEMRQGRLTPDRVSVCAWCGEVFYEHNKISRTSKITCSIECRKKQRNRSNSRPRKREISSAAHNASKKIRSAYCHRDVGRVRRQPCKRYKETCGGGCYRAENGVPVCYVEGFEFIDILYSAIDCGKQYK